MNKKHLSLIFIIGALCMIFTGCSKQVLPANTDSLVFNISSLEVPDNIKIVGLGEASHGVSEYQKMKIDVFKSLVTNNSCDTFIIEGDFGGALKVEQYIHGGSGTAKEAVNEIGFAIYRTQEMVDLIDWMRKYNETVPVGGDLHFYGMDMQRYDNNKEYLFMVLDDGAPELSERYKAAFASLTDENRLTLDSSALKQSENNALALLEEMDKQKDQIVTLVGEDVYDFARESANSIYQCSKLVGSNTNYNTLRDSFMAEKVKWFVEHGDGDMLFINGHNGHIGKVSAYGYKCLGELLTEEYGDGYFSIGTDAINTRFNSQMDDGFAVMEVKNSNTLTNITDVIESNYFYLDFATVSEDGEWQSFINNQQKMTALNVGISKWQQKVSTFFTQKIIPAKAYNGVIIFRDVTPSNLLPI
ncbi:erythromycin esterase family protein [Acetivibrio cellulolyticus]|uniref:erythromycin esterase family protein n=1 Tax=Acetivibrio cellulolyticus TaxID=35830 RepID=UPI0001E2E2DD|nr:erythromycin esterase family protein [Acetivibrio cellulolyticus]